MSRRWRELARDPRLWRRLLRAAFDVRYEAPRGTAGTHWQAQFRELRAAASDTAARPLRFRGVFTDGGVDGNDGRYWVDAMFSAADYEAYWCASFRAHSKRHEPFLLTHSLRSSAIGRNVHCVALLEPADVAVDPVALSRRNYMLDRCRVAGGLMFGAPTRRGPGRRAPGQNGFAPESDLSRWSGQELESFFVQVRACAPCVCVLGTGLASVR